MKKFQSQLKALGNGIIWWVGFVLVLIISSVVYATYSSLSVSTGDVLSKDKWNELVSYTVPPGSVIAYNGTSCPTGWTEAAGTGVPTGNGGSSTLDLRGEFIRGLDSGRWVDSGRVFASSQSATEVPVPYGTNGTQIIDDIYNFDGTTTRSSWNIQPTITSWNSPTSWTFRTTRPRNIALIYCVKN